MPTLPGKHHFFRAAFCPQVELAGKVGEIVWLKQTQTDAVILGAPLVGSTSIDLRRVFDSSIPVSENVDAQIFFVARLPRSLAGALVGATLASAGVIFQGLLRNPLATPFTLGISSGAALGAMLAITFGWSFAIAGITAVPLSST